MTLVAWFVFAVLTLAAIGGAYDSLKRFGPTSAAVWMWTWQLGGAGTILVADFSPWHIVWWYLAGFVFSGLHQNL